MTSGAGRALATVLLLGVAKDAARGQGGPPLVTDDPGTPGNRRWEINLAFTLEKRATEQVIAAPLLDANYGLGDRIQLKLEIPWVVHEEDQQSARNGLGNTLIGVKWRFRDESRKGIAIAVYPQIQFNTLRSTARRGLVEQETKLLLPLSFEKTLGSISANLEIGHVFKEGKRGRWLYGLAFGREFSEDLEALAEVFGTTSSSLGDAESNWNLGARWKLGKRVKLLVAAGTGVSGSAGQARARLLTYIGSQFLF